MYAVRRMGISICGKKLASWRRIHTSPSVSLWEVHSYTVPLIVGQAKCVDILTFHGHSRIRSTGSVSTRTKAHAFHSFHFGQANLMCVCVFYTVCCEMWEYLSDNHASDPLQALKPSDTNGHINFLLIEIRWSIRRHARAACLINQACLWFLLSAIIGRAAW